MRNGLEPTYALKTDQQFLNDDYIFIPGPKCNTEFSEKRINKLFLRNNIYIGDFKIPNIKDIKGIFKEAKADFKDDIYDLKRYFKGLIEDLMLSLKKRKSLPEGFNDEKFNKEFENDCGYKIDDLIKMGIPKEQIIKFLTKYDNMAFDRLGRKKIVEEYIQKMQRKNMRNIFLDGLRSNVSKYTKILGSTFSTKIQSIKSEKENNDRHK